MEGLHQFVMYIYRTRRQLRHQCWIYKQGAFDKNVVGLGPVPYVRAVFTNRPFDENVGLRSVPYFFSLSLTSN